LLENKEWWYMGARKPLIIGAQKLYLSLEESIEFANRLRAATDSNLFSSDIAICPSFVNLAHVAAILRGSHLGIGAQNVHQEDSGAFTGQVSIKELKQLGVGYVIVGHSELRREGETNDLVRKKVGICLAHGVTPIVCVGEDWEERSAGLSERIIEEDVRDIFLDIHSDKFDVRNVVVAYEPLWAIKAGKDDARRVAATFDVVNQMHRLIREVLCSLYEHEIAEGIRIVYGGSVDPGNALGFLGEGGAEGLLIGSASIKFDSFLQIIEAAEKVFVGHPAASQDEISESQVVKAEHMVGT
jgi:triosephosphate isomerase